MNKPTAMLVADRSFAGSALDRGPAGLALGTPSAVPLARYGEGRAPNWGAMAASFAAGGGLLLSLTAITMIHVVKETPRLTVVRMLEQRPPPPPPARPDPAPETRPPEPRAAIVAPPPLVPTVPSPVQVATTSSPAPDVPAPVPAAPTAAASPAAPAIESAGDLSSTTIEAKPPRYPVESRRKKEEGSVLLSVLLGTDGRVAEISVARSSGSDRLDRAALDAVRRWRWSPTRRGGSPVQVRGMVEIPFKLTRE